MSCLVLSCPVLSRPLCSVLFCFALLHPTPLTSPHLCSAARTLNLSHVHIHTRTHIENTRTAVCECCLYRTLVPNLMAINNTLSIVRTAHDCVFVILLFCLYTVFNFVLQLRFYHSVRMGTPMEPVTAPEWEGWESMISMKWCWWVAAAGVQRCERWCAELLCWRDSALTLSLPLLPTHQPLPLPLPLHKSCITLAVTLDQMARGLQTR